MTDQGEPFLPAYTVRRRKRTGRERSKAAAQRAGVGLATGGALGAAGQTLLTPRNPRMVAASAGLGAVGSGALAAATTPKHVYEMRRMRGVTARPSAPGEKPKVYVKGKPVTDEIAKGEDSKHVAEAVAGVGALAAGTNINRTQDAAIRGVEGAQNARKRVVRRQARLASPLPAQVRPPGTTKGAARRARNAPRIAAGKKAAGKLNAIDRQTKAVSRGLPSVDMPKWSAKVSRTGGRSKLPLIIPVGAAAFLGGGGATWHGTRNLVEKTVKRTDIDALAAGGAAGAGGYQAAMYATKPVDRILDRRNKAASMAGRDDPKAVTPNKILAQHRKKVGLESNAKLGDPKYLKFYRSYPKSVPGWQFKRTMSHLHGGKSQVALTTAAGIAGAGGMAAHNRKRQVSKRDASTADLPREWSKPDPTKGTGAPVVVRRRRWVRRTFKPTEIAAIRSETEARHKASKTHALRAEQYGQAKRMAAEDGVVIKYMGSILDEGNLERVFAKAAHLP